MTRPAVNIGSEYAVGIEGRLIVRRHDVIVTEFYRALKMPVHFRTSAQYRKWGSYPADGEYSSSSSRWPYSDPDRFPSQRPANRVSANKENRMICERNVGGSARSRDYLSPAARRSDPISPLPRSEDRYFRSIGGTSLTLP